MSLSYDAVTNARASTPVDIGGGRDSSRRSTLAAADRRNPYSSPRSALPPGRLAPGQPIDGIIALGGDDARISAAAELARLYPDARVVVTGEDPGKSRDIMLGHGVSTARLTMEPYASNTFENATFSAALLQPRPSQQWVLVTSQSHMPRAVGCFRKAGFTVLAWPVSSKPRQTDGQIA